MLAVDVGHDTNKYTSAVERLTRSSFQIPQHNATQNKRKSVHVFSILAPTAADAADGGPSSGSRHRLRRLALLSTPHLVDNIEVRGCMHAFMQGGRRRELREMTVAGAYALAVLEHTRR